MATTFDSRDQATAGAFEGAVKDAMVDGISGFTSSIMTVDDYTPTLVPATVPRDGNRDIGAAVAYAMRQGPLRLATYTVAAVPAAASHTGSLIYVSNGAAGSPVVAFSNGSSWKRLDSLSDISAV